MRAFLPLLLLLTTADHVAAGASRDRLIYIDDIAGGADRIKVATLGATAGLSIAPGAPRDTLARLLAHHDHLQCSARTDAPKAERDGRDPGAPPILCTAEAGWSITTHQRIGSPRGDGSAQVLGEGLTGH